MLYFWQGLLLGFAYVAPIGIQNLYVINSALRTNLVNTLKIALIIIFFDISLAMASFLGIGLLVENNSVIKGLMLFFGSIAVVIIGLKLILSKTDISSKITIKPSFFKIVASCFIVTWFNPQAIIDGTLLLGGFRASLPSQYASSFIFGVVSASFIWFISLAVATSIFCKALNNKVLRFINIICGSIIIIYGIKLGISFINLAFTLDLKM